MTWRKKGKEILQNACCTLAWLSLRWSPPVLLAVSPTFSPLWVSKDLLAAGNLISQQEELGRNRQAHLGLLKPPSLLLGKLLFCFTRALCILQLSREPEASTG